MITGQWHLDDRPLNWLLKGIDYRAPEVVKTVAFDVQAHARMIVPVLTGNLKSSIQVEQIDALTWRINVWAEYGIYVELGTTKMPARPYLVPSVERAYGAYLVAWRKAFE